MTTPLQLQPISTSVFKVRHNDILSTKIFMDESGSVDISRSDVVKYPFFKKHAEVMFANFWKPHEISLSKDNIEFNQDLSEAEQFIFTSNLKRQTLLDSVQSMSLAQAFLPVASDPMIKRCLNYISFFEELHSLSYEYIVNNVYTDPTAVMDEMRDIQPIVDCGNSVGKYYDDVILEIAKYRNGASSEYDVKRKLWLGLQAANALEGVRFFASFCTSFAFGNAGRMVGNASILKLIASDELYHVTFTTTLIRTLVGDDPMFARIAEECKEESAKIFHDTVNEEREWIDYLFSKGSFISLNSVLLKQELDWLADRRMRAIGLQYERTAPRTRPLPWMGRWLNEGNFQPAPQETEITSYVQNVQADINESSFEGISL